MGKLISCVSERCLPYPALPLTVDNVFEAVKAVRRSWREQAQCLMGWYDSYVDDRKKLGAIQHQHASDEACLKALVEAFLLGEGRHRPSWRMLIYRLHKAGQNYVAETIKTNAEPHQGEWVLVWRGRWGHSKSIISCWSPACMILILSKSQISSSLPAAHGDWILNSLSVCCGTLVCHSALNFMPVYILEQLIAWAVWWYYDLIG